MPVLYKVRMENLGSDCPTTVSVDSAGNVFSETIGGCKGVSTFEREIADVQAQSARLYKYIDDLREVQRKVGR